jgi:N-methylhydantoinase B
MDIQEGSYGGRHGKDGLDAVDTLYANTRNNPIEDIESHFPLRVTRYELLEDGGGDGSPGAVVLRRADGGEEPLPSKFPYRKAAAGERLRLVSPCGGGYGDPRERDPDAVRADLADGYVSPDSAHDLYHLKELT